MSENLVAVIRAKLDFPDRDAFIKGFAPLISAGGMFVRTKQLKPVGATIRFDFRLKNGERLLLGEGVVKKVKDGSNSRRKSGMVIRFTKLNKATKALVDQVVDYKASGMLPGESDAGAQEPAGSASADHSPPSFGAEPVSPAASEVPAPGSERAAVGLATARAGELTEDGEFVPSLGSVSTATARSGIAEPPNPSRGAGQLTSAGNVLEALLHAGPEADSIDAMSGAIDAAPEPSAMSVPGIPSVDLGGQPGFGFELDEAEVDDVLGNLFGSGDWAEGGFQPTSGADLSADPKSIDIVGAMQDGAVSPAALAQMRELQEIERAALAEPYDGEPAEPTQEIWPGETPESVAISPEIVQEVRSMDLGADEPESDDLPAEDATVPVGDSIAAANEVVDRDAANPADPEEREPTDFLGLGDMFDDPSDAEEAAEVAQSADEVSNAGSSDDVQVGAPTDANDASEVVSPTSDGPREAADVEVADDEAAPEDAIAITSEPSDEIEETTLRSLDPGIVDAAYAAAAAAESGEEAPPEAHAPLLDTGPLDSFDSHLQAAIEGEAAEAAALQVEGEPAFEPEEDEGADVAAEVEDAVADDPDSLDAVALAPEPAGETPPDSPVEAEVEAAPAEFADVEVEIDLGDDLEGPPEMAAQAEDSVDLEESLSLFGDAAARKRVAAPASRSAIAAAIAETTAERQLDEMDIDLSELDEGEAQAEDGPVLGRIELAKVAAEDLAEAEAVKADEPSAQVELDSEGEAVVEADAAKEPAEATDADGADEADDAADPADEAGDEPASAPWDVAAEEGADEVSLAKPAATDSSVELFTAPAPPALPPIPVIPPATDTPIGELGDLLAEISGEKPASSPTGELELHLDPELPPPAEPEGPDASLSSLLNAAEQELKRHDDDPSRPEDAILDDVLGDVPQLPPQPRAPLPGVTDADGVQPPKKKKKNFLSRFFKS